MKKVIYLLIGGVTLLLMPANAQTGVASNSKYGHGADSVECLKCLAIYQHDFKNKDYDAAIVYWRYVFKNCPESSVNNVPRGIVMYQYLISKELNPNAKSALVDTLMMIYEAGIASRPQKKGEYLAAMAQDMQAYLENTAETQKKILKIMEESIVIDKDHTLPVTYANYMNVSVDLNASGNLSDAALLDNYTKVSDWLSEAIQKTANKEFAKARDMIDYSMAKLFYGKGNFNQSLEYLDAAIKNETNSIDKANYVCMRGIILSSKFNKYPDAKKCALDAARLRPNWGEPYVLLANVYAQGPKCGDDDFEKAQVYWVVVDKLIKAKTVDPNYAERVNGSIKSYSKYFPKKEEAFFRNINEGTSVSIECWINETTKARW
ncbi:MAG: hypothetical protein LBN37_06965 [Bacteroidales bacterium]|nr:hypothetical protein [Bacteroidales bacterium]